MVCLLLVFSLSGGRCLDPGSAWENLLRTAEELSEWNLWYDVPPNRKEGSLATLAKTGSRHSGRAVFGWTEKAPFDSKPRVLDRLGLRMITEVLRW